MRPFVRAKGSEITDKYLTDEEVFGSAIKVLREMIGNSRTAKEACEFADNYLIKDLFALQLEAHQILVLMEVNGGLRTLSAVNPAAKLGLITCQ